MKLRSIVFAVSCAITSLCVTSAVNGQTFQTINNMNIPRAFSASVEMTDGTVLLLGGSPSSPSTEVDIYNPKTQTFTALSPGLLTPLTGIAATLLNDTTVLVVGLTSNLTDAAEIFDPKTQKFTATHGPMQTARKYASATMLPNGTVLIAGGVDTSGNDENTAELYDPGTGAFQPTTNNMHADRYWHTATLMRPVGTAVSPLDNKVVLAGGADGSGNARDGVEVYDPVSKSFSFLANLVIHRYGQVAYETPQGNLIIAGGCLNYSYDATALVETYNTSTQSFQELPNSMVAQRCFATGTVLLDGTFLITGGTSGQHADVVNSSAEVFDYGHNTFTAVGSMSTPAAAASAIAFPFDPKGTTATVLVTGGVNGGTGQNVPGGTPTTTAEIYTYTPNVSILNPAYQITSIIYAPPGNRSSDGFTTSTTNGVTSTVGSSFTDAASITFSEGFSFFGFGASSTQTFGLSHTDSSSAAFTETFTNATGLSNVSQSDPINHNNDEFVLWLNPQIEVVLNGSTPVSYAVGVNGDGNTPPDILPPVSAGVMMPNGLGNTTVPVPVLEQQMLAVAGGFVPAPGLAAICAHVIVSEYANSTCTLTDQCGCRPSDFAPILKQDLLLGQPGTADPLTADGSGATNCSNVTGSTSSFDCRYVFAPQSSPPYVAGPDASGYNTGGDNFTASDSTSQTMTFGGQMQESVGATFKGGTPVFSLTDADTLTWTQSQSTGTTTGTGNSQAVTLLSSTVGCNEDIGIYEDTVYHTFLFQQPPNNSSCGPSGAASTSLAVSPQTAITGGTVTLTATVRASAGGPPTGTVQFSSGTNVLGTASLNSSGIATLSEPTSGMTSGSYPLTAAYFGSASFPASLSTAVNLNVVAPTTVSETSPEAVSTMNGNMADSITAGDFGQDGNEDLAIAYLEDNKVRTLAIGTGEIGTYSVGSQPYDVVSGDLNGDGYPDLVTANSGDNTVSVLLNNGNGTFGTAVAYSVGHHPFQVAIGDLNGDGVPDLAVTNNADNTVTILYGVKGGTFTQGPTLNTAAEPYGVAIGDFARTGFNGIAVTCYSTSQLYVFPNNRNGTFGTPNIYTTDSNPAGLVVADFNGDGRLDIVTGNTIANDISFFAGNGDGTFKPGVISPSLNFPVSIAAGDMNGDGILDIVGVAPNFQEVVVTLGVGDGTFGTVSQREVFPSGKQPWAVALGDFNHDGKLDIATANTYDQVDLATVPDQQRYEQEYPSLGAGNPSNDLILNNTNVPTCSAPASVGINVCSPVSSSTVTSPVTVEAAATVTGTILRMELWMDGVKVYTVYSSNVLNTSVTLPAGSHRFGVVAVNTAGQVWKNPVYATVQ